MNRRRFFSVLGLPVAGAGATFAAPAMDAPVILGSPPPKRGPKPGCDVNIVAGKRDGVNDGGRVRFMSGRYELTLTEDGLYYHRKDD